MLQPPLQVGRWQVAPSEQVMKQPPVHELMVHSAPVPLHSVLQPPVGHSVVQSEPLRQVELQPPVTQLVSQVASRHSSSQPPSQSRLHEEPEQFPWHAPVPQPRLQSAPLRQSNVHASEIVAPEQLRSQVSPTHE